MKFFIKMVLTFPLKPPNLPLQLSFLMSEGVSPSLNPAKGPRDGSIVQPLLSPDGSSELEGGAGSHAVCRTSSIS